MRKQDEQNWTHAKEDNGVKTKSRKRKRKGVYFGRFEGIWEESGTDWRYACALDCENFRQTKTFKAFLEENKKEMGEEEVEALKKIWREETTVVVEGMIEWTLLKAAATFPHHKDRIGEEAGEVVRGFFDKQSMQLAVLGYEFLEHNPRCIGADMYRILLNPSLNKITCATKTHNLDWSGTLDVHRTASRTELYDILKEVFDEIHIVEIFVDLLHYFDKPTTKRRNWFTTQRKLNNEPMLPTALFPDIFLPPS